MATNTKNTEATGKNKQAAGGDWRKRESFGGFIRDVLIVAAILGVALWAYKSHVDTGKQVRKLGKEAKDLLYKDTPGAYAEAEKLLLEMIALDDSYPFTISSLAELYAIRWVDLAMTKDEANAHQWTAKAAALNDNLNERFGAIILEMIGNKKYAEAEAYAQKVADVAASSHVVNGIGRAFRAQGKLGEAKVAFKRAADTEWRNPRFACDTADLYFEEGDYLNARNFYTKGIEAYSEHARSLIGRSRADIARGQRLEDALGTLSDVVQRPDDQVAPVVRAMGFVGVAELMLAAGKLPEATTAIGKALEGAPNLAWAHFVNGRVKAASKDAAAAASEIDAALKLDKYVIEFYYGGATAMHQAGDDAKALALLDGLRGIVKEDDRFFLTYGLQLQAMARYDEALDYFAKAVDFNNFNGKALYAKGALLFDVKKDAEKAHAALTEALSVQERLPEAYVKIGEIFFSKKDWGEGCNNYAQALIKMKELKQPVEQLAALREQINTTLLKTARERSIAQAWMEETASFVQ